MDESGRGAVELAVALRDAHFQLKALARAWEERLLAGVVRGREPLGPTWHYGDDSRQAAYHDGQMILLDGDRSLICEIAVSFNADQADIFARAARENDDQEDGAELARTGPLEFPDSAAQLMKEIRRCVRHLDTADLSTLMG